MKNEDFENELNIDVGSITPSDVLKNRREAIGLDIKELAYITKISESNLISYENGSKVFGYKIAEKLGAALGGPPFLILNPDMDESEEIKEIKKRADAIIAEKKAS